VSSAPITRIVLKKDVLKIKGGRSAFAYTLDEPQQGRIAIRLTVGAMIWCTETPAKAVGQPPTTAANDRRDRFIDQGNLPASCPLLP
jgi:hypothetical protein